MKLRNFASLLSFAATAIAHGGIYTYVIDGVQYQGNPYLPFDYQDGNTTGNLDPSYQSIQRRWYFWPIYGPDTNTNLTCNYDGASTSTSLHAPIAAGSNITAFYDVRDFNVIPVGQTSWAHGTGPMLAYMAECPNDSCEGFDGSGTVWFKVAQYGLDPSATDLGGPWLQWAMVGGYGYQDSPGFIVTIPKNLKAGSYLIRHEIIMLASDPDLGAQFYPECAQLTVTGTGTKSPSSDYLVSFPGAYHREDPGIVIANWSIAYFNKDPIYQTTDYKMPGPKIWTGEE